MFGQSENHDSSPTANDFKQTHNKEEFINYVDKKRGVGVTKVSTIIHKLYVINLSTKGEGSKIFKIPMVIYVTTDVFDAKATI